jgi:2',3'-cyclic-nucleotide 2'-phosphodiesterase (5'-nucleotidase family)
MRGSRPFFAASLLLIGCGVPPTPREPGPTPPEALEGVEEDEVPFPTFDVLEAPVTFSTVDPSVEEDRILEAIVAPYRARMGEEIGQVIGEATGLLAKSIPEGTLGNFATDAMLWTANRSLDDPVTMALTNNGGLRIPVAAGPITVAQMFELMPFENRLSVLVLPGDRVQELCHQIAEKRGEPIAGFSFHIAIEDGKRVAQDIRVGGEPLDLDAKYRLVTNDYMANGGDSFEAMENPAERIDLPVLLRDAFIAYVQHMKVIEPKMEGRITGGIGS